MNRELYVAIYAIFVSVSAVTLCVFGFVYYERLNSYFKEKVASSSFRICFVSLVLTVSFLPTGCYFLNIAIEFIFILYIFCLGVFAVFYKSSDLLGMLSRSALLIYLCVLSIYIFPYIFLSYFGSYSLPSQVRIPLDRYSATDATEFEYRCTGVGRWGWQPKYIYFEVLSGHGVRTNRLGFIYLPLINLDYALWHKTNGKVIQ